MTELFMIFALTEGCDMTILKKEEEIKARLQVICICKGIKQGRICDIIQTKNCTSVDDVNQKTGSGSGGCKGRRCKPVIESILANQGRPLSKPHTTTEPNEIDETDFTPMDTTT